MDSVGAMKGFERLIEIARQAGQGAQFIPFPRLDPHGIGYVDVYVGDNDVRRFDAVNAEVACDIVADLIDQGADLGTAFAQALDEAEGWLDGDVPEVASIINALRVAGRVAIPFRPIWRPTKRN